MMRPIEIVVMVFVGAYLGASVYLDYREKERANNYRRLSWWRKFRGAVS